MMVVITVNSNNPRPRFYGKELRKVKGPLLLALKKAYKTIRKTGRKERRAANNISHKISRTVVDEALANDSLIILGKLKGIRKSGKGRGFNRKLNNGFPYYRLSQFIEYKVKWFRIKLLE